MLVSSDEQQPGCQLVTASINNYGAVVADGHNNWLDTGAGLLSVHDNQGSNSVQPTLLCSELSKKRCVRFCLKDKRI